MRTLQLAVAATFFCVLSFVASSWGADIAKIGVVDFQRILEASSAGKIAKTEIWLGTFDRNSWSDEWNNCELMLFQMTRLLPGHYFKGHSGHLEDIAALFYYAGLAHVFSAHRNHTAVGEALLLTDLVIGPASVVEPGQDVFSAGIGLGAQWNSCSSRVGLSERNNPPRRSLTAGG